MLKSSFIWAGTEEQEIALQKEGYLFTGECGRCGRLYEKTIHCGSCSRDTQEVLNDLGIYVDLCAEGHREDG